MLKCMQARLKAQMERSSPVRRSKKTGALRDSFVEKLYLKTAQQLPSIWTSSPPTGNESRFFA
jgi:hypothetical protein